MRQGWLVWRHNRLWLTDYEDEAPLSGPGVVGSESVDRIAFAMDRYGLLVFETPEGLSCWRCEPGDPSTYQPLPPLPAGRVDSTAVGLHPRQGFVTVLAGLTLHLGAPEGWISAEVPEGAGWVGLDDASGLWAVGSKPSTRIQGATQEATAWHRQQPGAPWQPVPVQLSFRDAFKAIKGGGFEEFSGVEASAPPLVLASECAWFMDDPSWFLYVRGDGDNFTVHHLSDRQLARLDRDEKDAPRAFTTDGEVWLFNGRRFRSVGLAASLGRVLGRRTNAARSVQMAYWRASIRGVVTLWREGRRAGRRTIASDDNGTSWRLGELIPSEAPQRFIAGWVSRTP